MSLVTADNVKYLDAEDVTDLEALAAFLDWLADGNKAQQVLDRWPKPAAGSRLVAHWNGGEPLPHIMRAPADTNNGCRVNGTRYFEAVFDACIDETYERLANTDGLRKAARTVRYVADFAKTVHHIETGPVDPTVCCAAFALRADDIRRNFGGYLFKDYLPLALEMMSYATMCNILGGQHPLDMGTLEIGQIIFSDYNMVYCMMSYTNHGEWCVKVKSYDIL